MVQAQQQNQWAAPDAPTPQDVALATLGVLDGIQQELKLLNLRLLWWSIIFAGFFGGIIGLLIDLILKR